MDEPTPKDVIEVGLKTVFGPVHELFLKLTGPAAEEYGLMWQDSLKLRRTKRLVKGLTETKRMLKEAGFEPQAVPDKLLLPIFEGMSLEDDEHLHTMWAALLANAASESAETVRPGFIATLREMAPDEAKLLAWIHDNSQGWSPFLAGLKLLEAQATLGFTSTEEANRSPMDKRMALCLDALEAQQVIRRVYWHPPSGTDESSSLGRKPVNYSLTITERGRAFIEACRPPQPKS